MRGVTIRSGFQRYSISVLPSRSAPTPGLLLFFSSTLAMTNPTSALYVYCTFISDPE